MSRDRDLSQDKYEHKVEVSSKERFVNLSELDTRQLALVNFFKLVRNSLGRISQSSRYLLVKCKTYCQFSL